MKKNILFLLAIVISSLTYAKQVKFSVDMTDETVSPNGIHVMGDFQIPAGYFENWSPDATKLTKEGSTNIYSIVVTIPAFKMYQYRFVNGDLSYEGEYVPNESRLVDPSQDNRWLYIDSLNNGITDIGAIKFGKNAPAGKFLLRFKVDMLKEKPITIRPHVEGSFQNWDPAITALYAYDDTVFQYIAYVDAGLYQFKYVNGNVTNKAETVPTACATSGNRSINVTADVVLPVVCFSSCSACDGTTGIPQLQESVKITLFPNPSSTGAVLQFNDAEQNHTVHVMDLTGKTVQLYSNYNKADLYLERGTLEAGIYFIRSVDSRKNTSIAKWIVQ